jgi:hypothetical protein
MTVDIPTRRRRTLRWNSVVALVCAAFSMLAFAGTASAAPGDVRPLVNTGTCRIRVMATSCTTTPTVRANPSGHYVRYHITGNDFRGEDWQMKDADTGIIVAQGHIDIFGSTNGMPKVTGLFGRYSIFVFNGAAGGGADIDNA